MNLLTKSLFAVVLSFAALQAKAQTLLADTPGTGFTTSYPPGNYNLGYQFKVGSNSLLVDALGFYDMGQNGLADAHQVGLWDLSGTLLASVTISAGSHSLVHGFAFVSLLSPVLIQADQQYILGAFWPTTADQVYADFFSGSQPTLNDATLIGERFALIGSVSGFSFPPDFIGATGFGWFGPNLSFTRAPLTAVPEASTYTAFGGVLLLLIAGKRTFGKRKTG